MPLALHLGSSDWPVLIGVEDALSRHRIDSARIEAVSFSDAERALLSDSTSRSRPLSLLERLAPWADVSEAR